MQNWQTFNDILNLGSDLHVELLYFDYMSPHCDLGLEDSKKIFFTQYWFMLMPHHNKFGYKWLSSSEDKYYHPDKTWTHRYSNSTHNPNQLSIKVLSAPLSSLQPMYSITNNHILIIYFISFHCDLHLENSTPFFFTWHSGSWWCITTPRLVTKDWVVQKISSGQSLYTRTDWLTDIVIPVCLCPTTLIRWGGGSIIKV